MKTNYAKQITDITNLALTGIYEKIKGKEPIIFFSEVKNAINNNAEELPEHFPDETIELQFNPGGYCSNEYYYVYGLEDNGLCINALCVDDALQVEKIEIESLSSHEIGHLADFINSFELIKN